MSEPYISVVERLVAISRSLNLTSILMIALLLMLIVPTYFAWRFLTDENFRHEFTQGGKLLGQYAPCIVLQTYAYGRDARHTVMVVYELDGRFEKIVGRRAPGKLTAEEIGTVCQLTLSDVSQLNKQGERQP